MNKNEYLSALKEALKDTDESVMKEIVSDYEEHFQAGMENGKSEEEICDDLGPIDDLVEEIKEAYTTNSKKDQKGNEEQNSKGSKFKDWHFNIPNIDGEKIGSKINSALDTAGEAISKIDVIEIGNTLKSTLDQATSSINSFADNYLKDFKRKNTEGYTDNVSKSYDPNEEPEDLGNKNVSYDAEPMMEKSESDKTPNPECHKDDQENFCDTEIGSEKSCEKSSSSSEDHVSESEKNEAAGLNLIIDGVCADVIVQKSSNDKINISYHNSGDDRQKQMFEFYSYREGNTVYAGIRRVGKAVFLLNLKLYSISITAEIPDKMGKINIKTADGDIRINNVKADSIIATAASGDIISQGVYTTDLRMKSSSGDIRLEDVNSIQLNAATLSGDIKVNNVEGKFIALKCNSGDIEARNLTADVIDNSSLSGDLEVSNMKAGECRMRSTSGDIEVKELAVNNADISSTSGDIDVYNIIGDGVRAGSTSGNVKMEVNVKRCHASSKSGNVKVKSNGDVVLESSSTSGDIDIILKNYGNGYSINSRTTNDELNIDYNNNHMRNLKSGTYTYGNQGSELILSTVSGDIHVTD